MTAQILQEELVKEIGVIFRDDLFKDSAGEYIKMNVYEQNLPIDRTKMHRTRFRM